MIWLNTGEFGSSLRAFNPDTSKDFRFSIGSTGSLFLNIFCSLTAIYG